MRKRRRLADKLVTCMCAVLCAFSALFYAPMEVSAEVSGSGNSSNKYPYSYLIDLDDTVPFDFSPYMTEGEGLYSVDVSLSSTFYNSNTNKVSASLRDVNTYIYGDNFCAYCEKEEFLVFLSNGTGQGQTLKARIYVSSYAPLMYVSYMACMDFKSDPGTVTPRCKYSVNSVSCEKISVEDEESYNNGYNAGYSEGESVGYGNGYSQGYADGESSVDRDAIYDEAFQTGKDSVDTQSYYDAGYQVGYDTAYLEGYESGYDVGYQSAIDRIASWGADTSTYPLRVSSYDGTNRMFMTNVKTSYPLQYAVFSEWTSNCNFNPNHTYRFDVDLTPTSYHEGSENVFFLEEDIFYLNIGGIKYKISDFNNSSVNSFFIPGDRMSTAYSFSWEPYVAIMGNEMTSSTIYVYYDLSFAVYDMGPSGDTQNHIANQTDSLTNGFDNSQGNTVNDDLSSGLNEYQQAEDSLWATATTGMKDFTFFDFESVPAMITGISFVTSIMGSWFENAGGASGVGIVLSILFSVMLVSMVLGLYRLYQSAGHRAEARQRHAERMERWKKGK